MIEFNRSEACYQYYVQISAMSRNKNNPYRATLPFSYNNILDKFECILDLRYDHLEILPHLTADINLEGYNLRFKSAIDRFMDILPCCYGLVQSLHDFIIHCERLFNHIWDKLNNRLAYTWDDYDDAYVTAYFNCIYVIVQEIERIQVIFEGPEA